MKNYKLDINKLAEKNNEKLEDIYINEGKKEDENKNTDYIKNFSYRPYSTLGGLRPFTRGELQQTATRTFNSQMENIFNVKENKEAFYQGVKDFQEKEVAFLTRNNKADHIKKIFSTLNYKTKETTTYRQAHGKFNILIAEFDEGKKKETLEHDFSNHYKKSFMKTYEENKIKHKIVIRK